MSLLVLYSRFSRDSRILREAAQRLGWDTLRLEGWQLPDWVDSDVSDVAIFGTMPDAAVLAENFSQTLLGCDSDWLPQLPWEFRKRVVERTTLGDALQRAPGSFVKSAITKHIAGRLWSTDALRNESKRLNIGLFVLVAEPVEFLVEYRCFVAEKTVRTMSPYRRLGTVFDDSLPNLGEPIEEAQAARKFADSVLSSPNVECPPAFVLDVGLIEGRGWAVVEANECWASGIYYCEPPQVLDVLKRACIPNHPRTEIHERWDFNLHYAAAVP